MIKRMLIMLVLVGVVLGGDLRLQDLRRRQGQAVHGRHGQSAADRVDDQARRSGLAAAARGGRQPARACNGADLSLEVAGIVEEIHFESGDDVEEGNAAAAPARRRRHRQAAVARGHGRARRRSPTSATRSSSKPRPSARRWSTPTPPTCKQRRGAGRRSSRRSSTRRSSRRRSPAVSASARSISANISRAGTTIVTLQALDPIYRRLLPAAAGARADQGRADGRRSRSTPIPDKTFAGKISAINPKVDATSRNVQVRATLHNPDHKLLPGMFATVDIDVGAPQQLRHAAADGDHLQPLRRHRLSWSTTRARTPRASRSSSARQTFVTTGRHARRPGRRPEGRQGRRHVVTAGQIKLRNGSRGRRSTTRCSRPTTPIPKPVDQ